MVVVVSFDLRHIVVWTFTRAVASSSTYFFQMQPEKADRCLRFVVVVSVLFLSRLAGLRELSDALRDF